MVATAVVAFCAVNTVCITQIMGVIYLRIKGMLNLKVGQSEQEPVFFAMVFRELCIVIRQKQPGWSLLGEVFQRRIVICRWRRA